MRSTARVVAVCLLVGLVGLSACSRSSNGNKTLGANNSSGTTAPTGVNSETNPDFGTLKNVCGPNKTGKTLTSTDRGVTANSIKITTISDPGFVGRPGLNQELFDASTVFTKWCNALGGINGRKIIDNQRDAAIVNYKAKVLEGCQTDFSMVGGGGVFDDTGQQARLNCLLPDLPGYVVSPQARGADLLVQALPNALDNINIGGSRYVTATFPGTTSQVGYLTANVPSTVVVQRQFEEGGQQIGWKTVYSQQYNATGETSWVPFAQAMKTKNVQGLVFVGEAANLAKLEQAFQSLSYYPKWISVSANFYDKQLIALGGGALKSTYVQVLNVPFFDAAKSPAMTKYLSLFQTYLPHGKAQAVLGVDSFSAWLLFANAATKCGADLTRKCMYNNAASVSMWDGGGLTAPANPAQGQAPICYTVVQATPSGFVKVDVKPNVGVFNCNPKNRVDLHGNYGQGATLASVGKSLNDLP
jgi:hypothetical protein